MGMAKLWVRIHVHDGGGKPCSSFHRPPSRTTRTNAGAVSRKLPHVRPLGPMSKLIAIGVIYCMDSLTNASMAALITGGGYRGLLVRLLQRLALPSSSQMNPRVTGWRVGEPRMDW
jgi:hypothetical protein